MLNEITGTFLIAMIGVILLFFLGLGLIYTILWYREWKLHSQIRARIKQLERLADKIDKENRDD